MDDEMEGEEEFFQGGEFEMKGEPPKDANLSRLCEEQKKQIAALEEKLREKDKQLQSLHSALSKHSPSPEAKSPAKAFFDPPPVTKPQPIKANVSGSEFWDSHLENNEGNDYSFEDIAAKGLWILNSATERKATVSQPQIHKKPTEVKRTLPPKSTRLTGALPPSPNKQSSPSPSKPAGKDPPSHKPESLSPQPRPIHLPRVPPHHPSPNKAKQLHASESPLKAKSQSLHQSIQGVITKELDFPLSQGYLRMGLKPAAEKQGRIGAARGRKLDDKEPFNPHFRKKLSPVQQGERKSDDVARMHRKTNSMAVQKGKK